MTELDIARRSIKQHEGFRDTVYLDSLGYPTVGWGTHLYEGRKVPTGCLVDLFEQDFATAIEDAKYFADMWWDNLSPRRRAVLIDMAYNLGRDRLMSFVNTRRSLQTGEYDAVARNMLASKWATQVGRRAETLAEWMREG